jgi:hypothetical protein
MKKHQLIFCVKDYVPPALRRVIRQYVPLTDYDLHVRGQNDPYADSTGYLYEGSKYKIGIIKEFAHYHKVYVAACQEMYISYNLVDLARSDWIDEISKANCDAYLVWPTSILSVWKAMFDDRLKTLQDELGAFVYPSYKETWLYENKLRTRDWLIANSIPHPQSWVFYDKESALNFVRTAAMPIVAKTNAGASATGVRIIRDRREASKYVHMAFTSGITASGRNPLDRQWGVVYFQEFLPDVKEWRMIRIGESYFGYRKEKRGDFHSGSGKWSWLDPGDKLLAFLKYVTDKGNFTSMNVDVFETEDNQLLVNELQTVFGATTPADMLRIDNKPGRYLHSDNVWRFEEGDFSRNMCANLRLEYLIDQIQSK